MVKTIYIASILAASVVSAQNIPESCTRVSGLVQSCVPSDATANDLTGTKIAQCLCSDNNFDDDIVTCIKDAGSLLPEEAQQALEAFDGYCALYGGGSTGGGSGGNTGTATTPEPTSEPTSEPTGSSGGSGGSENCSYIVAGVSSCWTDNSPFPTAAPVANCLCSGTDFDAAVEGCYSALIGISASDDASTIAQFANFCSSFSNGDFDGAATATDNSGPATTGFLDSPGATDTSAEDAPSSTRAIQTLGSASSSGSGSNPTTTGNPSSASGFKVALVGTTFAALFATVAMFL
ncbi:hypothetical protein H072_4134 [Dactylellina haptotyla CBS 200.50]|uniref:Extracellular membrane protein CFEM domain-containing protein n=1 Tax=Dactylellina haptotyla (strain CBS 200.50) TaxID=1284197 RepID=S8ALD7_DACHA|nr:hypothetical protein H072_4134 [Dactylellina haptotyla CBS 200.50]